MHITIIYDSQHKELQVMFGHIKKVYVDSSGDSGDVWLEASSGMYLLPFSNVATQYKDDLISFLQANNIKTEHLLLPTTHCIMKNEN